MLWQIYNINERWPDFYQIFEISLQLAILFILLKLGADQMLVLRYSELLLFLPFFLVPYIPSITGFLCCLSFICQHIHLLSVLVNSDFFLSVLIGAYSYIDSVYINYYQVELERYTSPPNVDILVDK